MAFIVMDLEFNQDFSSLQDFNNNKLRCPFEIIQIGAIKIDEAFKTISEFNRYVKPSLYKSLNPFITELTGITKDQLLNEETFSKVYKAFIEFIGGTDCIFCIWGMADIKELFRNAEYHELNTKMLPRTYINVQPYVSKHFSLPSKQLLRLEHAVKMLQVPAVYPFHNALYDAYYTGEIFKKINHSAIQPQYYAPSYIQIKQKEKQRKREIDIDKLIHQFDKMYERKMTEEEQEIIKLAYKMGKTNQFLK